MAERQRQIQRAEEPAETGRASPSYEVRVECIDGNVVRLQARGTETVAEVRSRALEELGPLASRSERYVVMTAGTGGEVRALDDTETLDQVMARGEELEFQLIPPAAWGWRKDGWPYPILC